MSTPEKDESAASAVAVADSETDADVAAGTDAARGRRRRWVPWLIRLAWLAGLIAVGIGLYLCYLHVSRTARVSSDGASNALQAWAMLHGNPMLRGWTVTDVSFYTTELPEYMLVEYFRGLNADVLHMSAAISYTLVVLTGAMLARGRATGREGVVRMLIAAGIMIAPQPRLRAAADAPPPGDHRGRAAGEHRHRAVRVGAGPVGAASGAFAGSTSWVTARSPRTPVRGRARGGSSAGPWRRGTAG
jgi:hypothetical protein